MARATSVHLDKKESTLVNDETSSSIRTGDDNASASSLTHVLSSFYALIIDDLDRFVYTTAPYDVGDIQCHIVRDRRGVEKGLFPIYYMYVERPNESRNVCHSY